MVQQLDGTMDALVPTGSPYIEANPKPIPKLVIEIPMEHTVSNTISNLRPWLTVSINGVRVADGYCAKWKADGPLKGQAAANGPLLITIVLPMPAATIAEIERARGGNDAEIQVRGEVEFSHAHDNIISGHALLGETRFLAFGDRNIGTWKHTIAQSDWIKHLREMGWTSLALVAVPLDIRGRKEAVQHLQRANDNLARGQWPEALAACYKALEASVPEGERETVGGSNPALSEEAREALKMIIRKAKVFMHEGRHDRPNLPDIGPTEARFAFLLTAGVAQLLP